jgi:hypothetical protein
MAWVFTLISLCDPGIVIVRRGDYGPRRRMIDIVRIE